MPFSTFLLTADLDYFTGEVFYCQKNKQTNLTNTIF